MSNQTCNCACCVQGIPAPHEFHLEQRLMPKKESNDSADAKRYRYLRDFHIGDDPESINLPRAKRPGLDAAVDAAIAKATGASQ